MAPIAERNRRVLEASEYAALVERTRAVMEAAVPAGATVAVVSRGDEALVQLPGRTGWHFPRAADGRWAGHHPADAATAIAHLEEMRAGGATHLVVPDSARWWLDHYDALAAHLDGACALVADDEACAVYALAAAGEAAAIGAAHEPGPAPVDPATGARMRRFLDALLPERCRVLVARREWHGLELPERAVEGVPDGTRPALAALARGRRAAEAGASEAPVPAYLVVPLAGDPPSWIGELLAELERTQAPLARRDRLAAVFDLHAHPDPRMSRP